MDGLVLVALLAFGVVLALLPGYWLFSRYSGRKDPKG